MFKARDLAEEATKLMIQGNEYSMDAQTRFDINENSAALTITWNGTQTFMANGKPYDSDNDK